MEVLKNLKPYEVFRYFEEICSIPHGSGNTKQISDYLVAFAKDNKLWYRQDAMGNVIIKKPGTAGYEDSKPVIIQGHIDMVCEKDADCDIDFATEGLRLQEDGTFVFAEGTTLGGDDGIEKIVGPIFFLRTGRLHGALCKDMERTVRTGKQQVGKPSWKPFLKA